MVITQMLWNKVFGIHTGFGIHIGFGNEKLSVKQMNLHYGIDQILMKLRVDSI